LSSSVGALEITRSTRLKSIRFTEAGRSTARAKPAPAATTPQKMNTPQSRADMETPSLSDRIREPVREMEKLILQHLMQIAISCAGN
jgi:hypothetical protein